MMLTVNGEKEFILDLNNFLKQDTFEFSIMSKNGDSMLNWGIDSVLCRDVSYRIEFSKLFISLNISLVKTTSYIILKNTNNDTALIKIIPNYDEIGEKTYVFKIGKIKIDGRKIEIGISSKRNNKNWDWGVSYKGEPMSYAFKILKTKLIITNNSNFEEPSNGYIELLQNESSKKIKINLFHKTCEETEIEHIEEAD